MTQHTFERAHRAIIRRRAIRRLAVPLALGIVFAAVMLVTGCTTVETSIPPENGYVAAGATQTGLLGTVFSGEGAGCYARKLSDLPPNEVAYAVSQDQQCGYCINCPPELLEDIFGVAGP